MHAAAVAKIGWPVRWKGRDERGVDCAGLLVVCRNEALGVADDVLAYGKLPRPATVYEAIGRFAARIEAADALPGDVVIVRDQGVPCHVGIVGTRGVIHADHRTHKIVETKLPVTAAFRLREV